MSPRFLRAVACAVVLGWSLPALAQRVPDLTGASLEDLMRIKVTSVARSEQLMLDVASAVAVLTQQDIRRSGLTSVPELLRLVPGVNVARIDANKWAVTIRGFNGRWSNKLLVLVDGRTVYSRQFSGVHWESLDLPVEDIERIEVVRGPGGSVWGANAVNGIVNIITKSAHDTRGGLVRLDAGTQGGTALTARYGGLVGETAYRVYGRWSDQGHSMLDDATAAPDAWQNLSSGMRVDWQHGHNNLTVKGDVLGGKSGSYFTLVTSPVPPPQGWAPQSWRSRKLGGNLAAQWTHTLQYGRSLQVRGFVDASYRDEPDQDYRSTTGDVDAQYETRLGSRQSLIAGAGYRVMNDRCDGEFLFSLTPSRAELTVFNAFVQDEISLFGDRLHVTLGTKLERENAAGWGVQPTARLLWKAGSGQRIWTAFSRALRTPSRIERGMRVNFSSFIGQGGVPVVLGVVGNPQYLTEELQSVEGGYRLMRGPFSVDAAAFYGHHERLQTVEPVAAYFEATPGPPHLFIPIQFANQLNAGTAGVEVAGQLALAPWWHLKGGYSFFHLTPHVAPTSLDAAASTSDGDVPAHQSGLRSSFALGSIDLDLLLFRTGALRELQVPAYTRADARLEWNFSSKWSIVVTGQNLFDKAHREFDGVKNAAMSSLDPRRATVQLRWRAR